MPYRVMIAGMHWMTTTRAQKPKKSRIRGPLMKTLLVAPPEARAAVLVARLRPTALHTAVKVCFAFMVVSFFCMISVNVRCFVAYRSSCRAELQILKGAVNRLADLFTA